MGKLDEHEPLCEEMGLWKDKETKKRKKSKTLKNRRRQRLKKKKKKKRKCRTPLHTEILERLS